MAPTSTTFEIICPQCKRVIVANASQVGTRITCTDCLEEFVVTRPAHTSAPAEKAAPPRPLEKTPDSPGSPSDPDDLLDEAWGDDRQQLDLVLNVAASLPKRPPPGAGQPYDFTMPCPLCGTRLDFASEQIGETFRCPDCHSNFKIREPSSKGRRSRDESAAPAADDEMRLSDLPPEPPKKARLSDFVDPKSFADVRRPSKAVAEDGRIDRTALEGRPTNSTPRIKTPEDASRDTLARAEQELSEKTHDNPTIPPSPMTSGIFRFLMNPLVVLRVFFIALALWLELGIIHAALGLTGGGAMQQFGSVLMRPLAMVFGVLFAVNFATTLLAILQETAQGRDEIEGLPGANPVEWFVESWTVFVSLFLTWVLAGLAAQGIYVGTGSITKAFLFGAVPAGVLLVTVFPVILLSFLENSAPYSSNIWRGLQLGVKHWIVFMMQAGLVTAFALGLCVFRWNSSSALLNFLIAFGLILASMIFFRLLGRLTWVCQERLAELRTSEAAEQ